MFVDNTERETLLYALVLDQSIVIKLGLLFDILHERPRFDLLKEA